MTPMLRRGRWGGDRGATRRAARRGGGGVSRAPEPQEGVMAAVSHLPHVAAFATAACLTEVLPLLEAQGPVAAPTTSLRDTTRIAASSPPVWRDILLANRTYLL